jgi:hypothetical protein
VMNLPLLLPMQILGLLNYKSSSNLKFKMCAKGYHN